ncbi:MAG: Bifunctional PLP-dependent enzyme with beta-cystathionase and maltose regulon repressor activities [uncultured Rubellimicrobium sp.]|uniref:cysteine-S-conjugate beta-lyase n=1 Tax=uncultured Rubellimicrobium sp. TaxID=543078 RepID=A0A6J4Q088_9RHOB|nr:MAG: Bifunctional PLP-dependent enzyme with beta-cystathionase and maltose regulon repressor activities [uncultured Rubellimicrobium sp.]
MTLDLPTAASDAAPDFDQIIDRRGTHCVKWDMMEPLYGVRPDEGLAMWVADMDFRPPACVQRALERMTDHGVYGYFGDDRPYLTAIRWWMRERHGWDVAPEAIHTTHGLVNGVGLAIQAWTQQGDAVVLFTPVYHAFARVIRAAGRHVTECPLVQRDGRYEMDFAAYEGLLTGRERMLILCSPHNPGGRVWTREELEEVAAFARRHDLVLVSDEIHHDLVMPGHRHTPMALIPGVEDRLVMMTATTKTFNIAGAHIGNVIVPNESLRAPFAQVVGALGISPNSFGMHMATAAYSPEGAAWVDALTAYLDGNRRLFDEGVNAIPGVRSMALEATYLAWVDFSALGMESEEIAGRLARDAGIAANAGPSFGTGGEGFMRLNLAAPRATVAEAVGRLQRAFGDVQ